AALVPAAGTISIARARALGGRPGFLYDQIGDVFMKTHHTVTLAMLAGFGLGAVAVQGLHAQAKPPVYYISEIAVTDLDGYLKEYAPKVQALIKASGGRQLAAGQNVTAFEGAPPAPRVAIQ